jgi:hypothetical protein
VACELLDYGPRDCWRERRVAVGDDPDCGGDLLGSSGWRSIVPLLARAFATRSIWAEQPIGV